MYKFLLCWRYLRTRHIALASVISVTLGVATMIVVNAVMSGFVHEMQDRIHGILSDVVFESHSLDGFADPQWHMEQIERVAGEYIAGMTPTVHVPAMLNFPLPNGQFITKQVNLLGIEEATHAAVSDFSQYLQHPENRRELKFELRESGYDVFDHQGGEDALERVEMRYAGWQHRRAMAEMRAATGPVATQPGFVPPTDNSSFSPNTESDPFHDMPNSPAAEENVFDPARETHPGAILGIALGNYRDRDGQERFLILPGDDVTITYPTAGTPPRVQSFSFTVVDYYESKMSEYDAGFVFVPLKMLQRLRGMLIPGTDVGRVSAIQIKLKDEAHGDLVRDLLRQEFDPAVYQVSTWRDKQGTLLAAVHMETTILNILLFLIICVAGFGILAIFFMIVVEKTRDIGILKSLGAPGSGVMSIFLGYGLSLGCVGSGAGMLLGLLFVAYINEIADLIGVVTGREVFDPSIYYFQKIPTIVEAFTVGWIVTGAIAIAVAASILPARRAARLRPVEALRYE